MKLVMTFVSELQKDVMVTKTQIFDAEFGPAKIFAESVIQNDSQPKIFANDPAVQIISYAAKEISCGHAFYPGAKTTCTIN